MAEIPFVHPPSLSCSGLGHSSRRSGFFLLTAHCSLFTQSVNSKACEDLGLQNGNEKRQPDTATRSGNQKRQKDEKQVNR